MKIRAVLIVAGALLMAYGIGGALTDQVGIFVFLIAVLVAHDAVWMPALLAVGAVVACVRSRRKKSESPREGGATPADG